MEEAERLADRIVIIDHGQRRGERHAAASSSRTLPAAQTLQVDIEGDARPRRAAALARRQERARATVRALTLAVDDLARDGSGGAAGAGRRGLQGAAREFRPRQPRRRVPRPHRAPTARLTRKDIDPMNAFIALVRKDLVLYFSNRRALLMSIAAPILIAAFFGALFGNSDSKPARISVSITDLDRSELSGRVVAALRGDATFDVSDAERSGRAGAGQGRQGGGRNHDARRLRQARPGTAMFGGTKPELVLHYDPSQAMALQVVRGLLAQHVMQTVSQSLMSTSSPLLADLQGTRAAKRDAHGAAAARPRRRCSTASRGCRPCRRLPMQRAPPPRPPPSRCPMSRARKRPARARRPSTTATRTRSPAWACSSCC